MERKTLTTNEWTEWEGADEFDGPLENHIWCETLQLDGEIDADFAGEFNWSDLGDWGGNIIAYRIPVLNDPMSVTRRESIDA